MFPHPSLLLSFSTGTLTHPSCLQFENFCDALTASAHGHVKPDDEARKREIVDNYARWIVEHEVKKCPGWEKQGAVEKVSRLSGLVWRLRGGLADVPVPCDSTW